MVGGVPRLDVWPYSTRRRRRNVTVARREGAEWGDKAEAVVVVA